LGIREGVNAPVADVVEPAPGIEEPKKKGSVSETEEETFGGGGDFGHAFSILPAAVQRLPPYGISSVNNRAAEQNYVNAIKES